MSKQMAHADAPLCVLPTGKPIYADQLDYRLPEFVRIVLAYAVVGLFVTACVFAPLVVGAIVLAFFGW